MGEAWYYLTEVENTVEKLLEACEKGSRLELLGERLSAALEQIGAQLQSAKRPVSSSSLVNLGKRGHRIVDYVSKMAKLVRRERVRLEVMYLVGMPEGRDWQSLAYNE